MIKVGQANVTDTLYDAHTHVFTNDVAHYPIDVRGAREGEEAVRRRIDANPVTPERLLELWDENNVSAGAGVQYNTIYKTDNRFLLDSSDRYPDRISAVVILNADSPATPDQLDGFVRERKIVGLRLFGYPDDVGNYPWLDGEAALNTWDVAARHNLKMVLMYAPSGPTPAALDRIAALARRYPDLAISLDHFGWPGGSAQSPEPAPAIQALASQRNIYFKLSTINFRRFAELGVDPARFVRRAADMFGTERMMWGSDIGNTPETYETMARQARASAELLNPTERRQFLHDTGRALFERRA